jgi:uncharacterized protein (DUF362 family)
MKKITRRTFMKLGTGSALALGSGSILSACGKKDSISGPDLNRQINATVAAVKGNNLDSMTRDAIAAVGGMDSLVNEGETVFIKPNFVSFNLAETRECFKNGECTKPEILIATAEECLKAGAKEVIIGDGSQKITYDWKYSYTLDGRTNLVDLISNIYRKADKVISIPVGKTHNYAQLTLALKNFVGVLSIAEYGVLINNSYWDRGGGIDHSSVTVLSQAFLDVVAAKKPDLTIVDFSIGVEGDGPTAGSGYGRTVNVKNRLGSWLILASKDIMAADATAARVMNHHVPNIKQLTMGYDMGLGEINEESIEMIGEKLSDIKMNWQAAVLKNRLGKKSTSSPIAEQFRHIMKWDY